MGFLPDNLMKKKMKLSKWKSLMALTLMVGGSYLFPNVKGNDSIDWPTIESLELELEIENEELREQLREEFLNSLPPLHQAVARGNLSEVRRLLSSGKFEVNDVDKTGRTPLHYCFVDESIALELIVRGADVLAKDEIGEIPLVTIFNHIYSPDMSIWEDKSKVFMLLLRGERGKKQLQSVDRYGNTPLHIVVCTEEYAPIARLFVHAGEDVNAKNEGGDTPLHIVAENFDYTSQEIIKILLEEGHADTTVRNNEGLTPAGVAIKRGNTKAAELIFNHKQKH